MSKKDDLKNWMRETKVFATHDVIAFGSQNYDNRADRSKRDFMRAGLIRRLSDAEVKAMGIDTVEGWYKWTDGYKTDETGQARFC